MNFFSTQAIILKRIAYGDYDIIITFLTKDKGKITAIAKHAKKSVKRFSGVLELFSHLNIVCGKSRAKQGVLVLQEAEIINPFADIRDKFLKTAYAGYWSEIADKWLEKESKQEELFFILQQSLNALDKNSASESALSIIFQVKFLKIAGIFPDFSQCAGCGKKINSIKESVFIFYVLNPGLFCKSCFSSSSKRFSISKGAVKELLWIDRGDFNKAVRIRFTQQTLRESEKALESFLAYHIGSEPVSLRFLERIRKNKKKFIGRK